MRTNWSPCWPSSGAVTSAAICRKAARFECLFAEVQAEDCMTVVGFALYFHNYSTWEGLGVYLEDLYVQPAFRSRGIGTALIKGVAQAAEIRGCARLQWQVRHLRSSVCQEHSMGISMNCNSMLWFAGD